VAVNTGAALVYGFYYFNDASVNVNIPTPASATRIDRIVLRASWSAQTVRITRIAGSEGSGSAPAMTQTANTTWDIPLANVSITTGGVIAVTDQRTYVKHPGVYGWLNQANTWTGNQTITGTLAATQHQTDSSNYWTLSGGTNPVFVWDGVNDYTLYNRAGNTLSDVIGGVTVRSLNASGDMTIPGSFSAGGLNASQLTSGTVPVARLSGITTSQLSASAGIVTGQLAEDAVDDTKVGNRVPQFWRRQGGSASNWSSAGTSTQTPAAVRMQAGAYNLSISSGLGSATITFPTAFSQPPLVFLSTDVFNLAASIGTTASTVTTSGFELVGMYGSGNGSVIVRWLAIGPE
jgi:hypothetical protein